METNDIIVHDERTLKNFMAMALRYALGRQTYVSSEVPDFIKLNEHCIDERICDVMLVDLIHYLHDRETGLIVSDDECDYKSWKKFYNWLLDFSNQHNYFAVNHLQWVNIYKNQDNQVNQQINSQIKTEELHIKIKIATDKVDMYGVDSGVYDVNTHIQVPKIGQSYWMNYENKQIKVYLTDYLIKQSIENKILIVAYVIDRENNRSYEVLTENLFKSENAAYDYYLQSKYGDE